MDTIFALSSGPPPAAIGVVRISGPLAGHALECLAGFLPEARRATLSHLRNAQGTALDDALVLWLPGPNSATGEDLAELHCHGGRAVIVAVERTLGAIPGVRRAEPGEFTRRAFIHGRIDLAEAEGLADLLEAETELQRRAAIGMASGAFSRTVDEWRSQLLSLAAQVEARLDFADEDDVAILPSDFRQQVADLANELAEWVGRPRAEALKQGYRVVFSGPPNAGKSTLFNAVVESEAAITAPTAGTTRDVIERSVAIEGIAFTFVDTAGLHAVLDDTVEAIGIERAREEIGRADLVVWLGPEGQGPAGAWEVEAQIDRLDSARKREPLFRLSALTGEGMDDFKAALVAHAGKAMPRPGEPALNARQGNLLGQAANGLREASEETDPLLVAENMRRARVAFDRLLGRTTTEDMLDALFGRFCIGK